MKMNSENELSLKGKTIYFVGIKGTGMAALAELYQARGAAVSGSDGADRFYTDEILKSLGIPYYESFSADHLPEELDMLVFSAAYDPDTNPEILEARSRGVDTVNYAEALGALSATSFSVGIAGVHGKTTTSGLAGTLCDELELPMGALVGSAVSSFGDRSTIHRGDKYFIAETCEYRRHFLKFSPSMILLTSVEPDHLDYFRDIEDIYSAFMEYGEKMGSGGQLVYCADDPGACVVAERLKRKRRDLKIVPYGKSAKGRFRITDWVQENGENCFSLAGWDRVWKIQVPGEHIALDAAGALAVGVLLSEDHRGVFSVEDQDAAAKGLWRFAGSRRRCEILGEADGVLFIDDYAHHPTAVAKTLQGFREFYPDRRIIVDFMSHTYSRTEALLEPFSKSFSAADIVVLHKIYASAREKAGKISGRDLYEKTRARHGEVRYTEEVMDALDSLKAELRTGDLFVTMGAGDNFRLGRELFRLRKEQEPSL